MTRDCRHQSPFFLLTMILVSITSCHEASDMLLPASSGRPYEVMVVCNRDVWGRIAGRALFRALDADIPGLPQPEPSFRVSQIDSSGFNQITNIFRNIIIVDINPTLYSQTRVHYRRNVYALSQVIMYIDAPSEEELTASMPHFAKPIATFFTKAEFGREMSTLASRHNIPAEKTVESMFGYRLWIPSEIASTKRGKDFLWISNNTATGMQNFCIYTYPIGNASSSCPQGDVTVTRSSFIKKRDSILGANIPGEQPGMYMQTAAPTVVFQKMKRGSSVCYEARGLWEMKNDCMGGPFVSHSYIDLPHRRIIVVEAFVYAPESKKRNLMRTLEGALYTFKRNLK